MREILFRGIPMGARGPEDPTFVYGWLECDAEMHRTMIHFMEDHKEMVVEVGPRTVGQYTGLTDKNGAKIFEGDIIRIGSGYWPCAVEFNQGCFEKIGIGVRGTCRVRLDILRTGSVYEVIGNIYDNPELLEVP